MSPEGIGVAAGGAFGLLNMGILRAVAARIEARATRPEQKRTAGLLRKLAVLDLVVFTVLGYFLVPMVLK